MHGEIIEAISIQNPSQKFVIKQVDKTDTNIIKEAMLSHHCTVENRPTAPYISQYIDFFNDEKYCYLVSQYHGNTNLKDWTKNAFEYIKANQLQSEEYQKTIKSVFWKISVLLL